MESHTAGLLLAAYIFLGAVFCWYVVRKGNKAGIDSTTEEFLITLSPFILVLWPLLVVNDLVWEIPKRTKEKQRQDKEKEEKERELALKEAKRLEIIGKVGRAVTAFRLSGVLDIEGERYQGISRSGPIEAGESVIVHSIEGAILKVEKYSTPTFIPNNNISFI
jgi:membrane-bound ClpP family serine protease